MDLTVKYRPQTYDEFVGDKDLLEQLEKYVNNDVPTILVGNAGVGKTTMAYLVANKLGMTVLETNASDQRRQEELKEIERNLKVKSMTPTLYLFEEIDGMEGKNQRRLSEIVKKTTKPIIITANDEMKVDLQLKKYCKTIKVALTKTDLQAIVNRIKHIAEKEGIKDPKYRKIKNFDLRSSIRCVLENSHGYKTEENSFEKITKLFKDNEIQKIKDNRGNDTTFVWVLDNIPNFYHGLDIYKSIRMLGIVADIGDIDLMSNFPKGKGKAKYPYYLRKRSKYYAKHNG